MKELLNFFIEIGKLKKIPRKGWVLIGIKNPETIAGHTFHEAIMAWILAKEKRSNFNIERILKIALVHDLCELYAGDMTPYDEILPKDKKEWPKLFDKWPRFLKSKKIKKYLQKHKKERASLIKLTSKLPPALKKEILNLWLDYEKGLTKEGRFVRQVGRLTTLLQALEYGKETKRRPYKSWWVGSKETIDDPLFVNFIKALEKKFHQK
jgi:putative hydrolase of HD superfamily